MSTDPTWDYFNGRKGRKHRDAAMRGMALDKAREIFVRALLMTGTAVPAPTADDLITPGADGAGTSVGYNFRGLVLLGLMLPDTEVGVNVRRLLMPLGALNIPTTAL